MKKITKLTKKQEELMYKIRDEWLDKLFKRRVKKNDKRCIELIQWLYKISDLEKPIVVFLDSTLGIQYGANLINNKQVGSQVGSQVESQVWSQVWSQVRSQVGSQVGSQVESQVKSQVESQVWSQVWSQVRSQVWSQVGSQVGSQVRSQYYRLATYGDVWDYGWLSFCDFFKRVGIDIKAHDLFNELMQYDIFNMIQLEGICFVSRHPKYIKRDNRNNMHCEDGYAIEFFDGYGQHYLNGVALDEKLYNDIIKNKLSFKKVMAIENMEQRMTALKYMDADKLLKGAKAKLMDEYKHVSKISEKESKNINYQLYLIKDLFEQDAYFLRYECRSTDRVYISGIEPDIGKLKSAEKCICFKLNINSMKEVKYES